MLTYVIIAIMSYLLGTIPSLRLIGLPNRQSFVRRSSLIYVLGLRRSLGIVGIDFAKGVIAVLLGLIAAGWGGACIAALAVNVGAAFPVFPSFRGNTCTATAAGALLVLSPLLLLVGLGIFMLTLFLTQYLSLSTLLSTAVVLMLLIFFPPAWFVLVVIFLLGVGVLILHRESFLHLLQGKESAFPIRRWMR